MSEDIQTSISAVSNGEGLDNSGSQTYTYMYNNKKKQFVLVYRLDPW